MTAVQIPVEVGSEEWLAERRKGIGASEIAVVLGIAPDSWASPYDLYWQKKGAIEGGRSTDEMEWGQALEGVILERFAKRHPEFDVRPGGLYRHPDRPWQLGTPDGLATEGPPTYGIVEREGVFQVEPSAVVQVKTAGSFEHWGEDGSDVIPPYYVAQVRYEMSLMGVDLGYVPVLFNGRAYREYLVEQNQDDVALMLEAGEVFMKRLENDDPPDIDWRPATTRALKQLHPKLADETVELEPTWLEDYQRACVMFRAAKKAKRLEENQIRERMGDAAFGVLDGETVVRRSIYPVKGHWREPYETDRLYIRSTREEDTDE